jgi:hypothetical protein
MYRERVKSRSIDSIGYDDVSETLDIKFLAGSLYRYYGVPEQTYIDLMTAPSIGRFVNYRIKPYFRFQKIVEEKHKKSASNRKILLALYRRRKSEPPPAKNHTAPQGAVRKRKRKKKL